MAIVEDAGFLERVMKVRDTMPSIETATAGVTDVLFCEMMR